MTVDQGALSRAEEILSQKNSGPSGVLAYMWANYSQDTQIGRGDESFVYKRPRLNKGLMADIRPFYAVVETDRSGLTVTAPPGGTQDVLFELYGQQQFAELAKPKKQIDIVAKLTGETLDSITDELFVAHLLGAEGVGEVYLESAFDAAVRETAEEHGWDFEKAKPRAKRIFDIDEELLSKRSFQTNPPTPIRQKVFVVEVDNFDGAIPRYTEKTETKIPSMLGNEFYEKGNFMDLREVEYSLNDAGTRLAQGDLPEVAKHDYLAAKSRFEMMQRIEKRIIDSTPN